MSTWNKKAVSRADIETLQQKYGIDALTASIMVRRDITQGRDILFYMEDDLRFQHSPFNFVSMEDAVDRILSAKEENEKVLIFGDRDVDGVSATTVLYDCLSGMGIDVSYRLPSGDDAYGLSMVAVDEFAGEYGSLIITVDCGISNNLEIAHAGELGIDVIVLDHHNPPSLLPEPAIIVDAKTEGSGYPFPDISGCAVVYKVVSALRFSLSRWYKQEVTLLDAWADGTEIVIDCVKLRNLIPLSKIQERVPAGSVSVSETRLPSYLRGQMILGWDAQKVLGLLHQAFGSGAEFNIADMQEEIGRAIPKMKDLDLDRIMGMSKIAKYGNHAPTRIGGFYNIFVTYVNQSLKTEHPEFAGQEERDLQLVALAALADIMPMKNENRIFVRNALASINAGRIRPGLLELMSRVNLLGKRVTSTDLSWVLVSHLNAAGRMGHPELAAELFLTRDDRQRDLVADKILACNSERKQLSLDAWGYAALQAETSLNNHSGKLCVVIDERINRGISGILAGRLMQQYNVPAMAVTFVDNNIAIGSMRSCRGVGATDFLDKMGDIFINHGGHNAAAGFSFTRDKLPLFEKRLKELAQDIQLEESQADTFSIDAEIPPSYLNPSLIQVCDRFEPSGENNPQLLFMTRNIPVQDAIIMGKTEKMHLKVAVSNGKTRWTALMWNEGERLHRDFEIGDKVDILYHVERNVYNGMENLQLVLSDIQKSR